MSDFFVRSLLLEQLAMAQGTESHRTDWHTGEWSSLILREGNALCVGQLSLNIVYYSRRLEDR